MFNIGGIWFGLGLRVRVKESLIINKISGMFGVISDKIISIDIFLHGMKVAVFDLVCVVDVECSP